MLQGSSPRREERCLKVVLIVVTLSSLSCGCFGGGCSKLQRYYL